VELYRAGLMEKEKSLDILVPECLKALGISLLVDWDVLIFLYRHPFSLGSAAQIARLLGYPSRAVGDSLETLESLSLVRRSRSSQGMHLYQFVFSEVHIAPKSCFRQLMSLAENRTGRLLLVKNLRRRAGLHIAGKERAK
jgi:hypothetical protein